MNKQEKDLYNALEKAREAYHHTTTDPNATMIQINAAKEGVDKFLLSLKNYYLSGVNVPENIKGDMFAMRKNESTVQISCSIAIGEKVLRVSSTASSQREVAEKFNSGEFDRSAVNFEWQGKQIALKKDEY